MKQLLETMPAQDPPPPDTLLLERIQSSEDPDATREAFRVLYQRYSRELFPFLVQFTRSRALAEDALQEAFCKAYAKLPEQDPKRSVRSWLFSIARNAAVDLLRSEGKQKRLAKAPQQNPKTSEAVADLDLRAKQDRVHAILTSLPEEERSLLVQRYFAEHKLTTLAETFTCSERTVRTRLRKAAVNFARAFFAEGEEQ